MASYTYDETGHMALFFIITVLFMVLVPVTFSQISFAPSTYVVPYMIYSLTAVAYHPQKWKYPRPLASAPHVTKNVHVSLNTRRALFSDLNSQLSVSHSTYVTNYD
jgi:preprotein translocase subunit Sec63